MFLLEETSMENDLSKIYHIVLCDDDPAYIHYAKELFLRTKEKEEHIVFYEYMSGEELLKGLEKKRNVTYYFWICS